MKNYLKYLRYCFLRCFKNKDIRINESMVTLCIEERLYSLENNDMEMANYFTEKMIMFQNKLANSYGFSNHNEMMMVVFEYSL